MATASVRLLPVYPTKGCGIRGARLARHNRKGSSTAGKMKGAGCVADHRARGVCRVSRSYKWGDYDALMAKLGKGKARG